MGIVEGESRLNLEDYEARKCKQTGESKVIVFNNSGHGLLDMSAYEAFQSGQLEDWEPTNIEIPSLVPE